MDWHEADGVEWLEARLPGARVAFSTRRGGVSLAPYDSLNLGILTDDEPGRVVENRLLLAVALGLDPQRVVAARQVHGAELAVHDGPQTPAPYAKHGAAIPEVDGHVVAEPGLAALVFVADCLPVALAGPGGVAMLHCGWRGLAAGIVEEGVVALRELGSRGILTAAIGPGAGRCCYEVGDEVRSAFADLGPEVRDGRRLDLKLVTRRRLEAAGVADVHDVDLCTMCSDPSLFFSHRRDGAMTGRQAGLVWRS
jgi:YfiH family protein